MIIYKKDSKGKLRTLEMFTDGADVVQISGLDTGKKVTARSTSKPKNIGRSNETTAEQQALLEVQSKLKKKLRKEYFETIKDAMTTVIYLPMLAEKYQKFVKKLNYGTEKIYGQAKLDGMRSLFLFKGGSITIISRENVVLTTMEHIKPELMKHYVEGMILDGELYAHGLSFQENMKIIKKYRPGRTEHVKLHMYDVVNDMEYSDRREWIANWFSDKTFDYVEQVPSHEINSQKDLDELHQQMIHDGYEGTIVRVGKGSYKLNGRSQDLLKYKDFIDEAFEIVDVVPSEKRPLQGKFVLKTKVAGTADFDCGMKYSHADREEILRNKQDYIGQIAELRFFEYTDIGLPRFPVAVGTRIDKSKAD